MGWADAPEVPDWQKAPEVKAVQQAPAYDPSEGGGTLQLGPFDTGIKTSQGVERFLAGAGEGMTNIGRGIGQAVGLVSRDDVARSRKLDAPLNATGAGQAGNISGSVATMLPSMFIPGANTVVGAGIIGAGSGLLQPSTSTKETAINTGLGALMGAGGQYAGNKLGQFVTNKLVNKAADTAEQVALNAPRDAILKTSQEAGYGVPPTAINPNATNTALESIAGKAATRQALTQSNAKVTNSVIKADADLAAFGMKVNAPITRDALQQVRENAGTVYGAIKHVPAVPSDAQYAQDLAKILQSGSDLESAYPGIGAQANQKVKELVQSANQAEHTGQSIVDLSKLLRNQSSSNFKSSFVTGNPESLELAKAQTAVANAAEDLMQRHLQRSGQQSLSEAWDQARTAIAKSYTAQAALKGNNVSAVKLAAQLQKGKRLTGGFKLAADFADQFPEVAGVPKSGAGVSKLGAAVGGGGALASLMSGNVPLAVGAAALPAISYGTKAGIVSKAGQSLLATPSYGSSNLLLNSGKLAKYLSIPTTNALLTQTGK